MESAAPKNRPELFDLGRASVAGGEAPTGRNDMVEKEKLLAQGGRQGRRNPERLERIARDRRGSKRLAGGLSSRRTIGALERTIQPAKRRLERRFGRRDRTEIFRPRVGLDTAGESQNEAERRSGQNSGPPRHRRSARLPSIDSRG